MVYLNPLYFQVAPWLNELLIPEIPELVKPDECAITTLCLKQVCNGKMSYLWAKQCTDVHIT